MSNNSTQKESRCFHLQYRPPVTGEKSLWMRHCEVGLGAMVAPCYLIRNMKKAELKHNLLLWVFADGCMFALRLVSVCSQLLCEDVTKISAMEQKN